MGYVSRFQRNLKQALIAVEDYPHAAGVVVLFVDERLLSSHPGSWDQFIREAHEAEAYSRKHPKEWYEDAVGELLGHIGSLDDHTMTEVMRLYGEGLAKPDELTLARIERVQGYIGSISTQLGNFLLASGILLAALAAGPFRRGESGPGT